MVENIKRNSLTDMLVSGSGSMVAPLINFAAIPVVMRIYSPFEYGQWMLLLSIAIILGNLSTFRYELALVLADGEQETGQLLGLCLSLVAGISVLALIVILVAPWWLNLVPALAGVKNQLWAVPILTLLIGLSWIGRSFCTRQRAFIFNSLSFIGFAVVTNGVHILAPRYGLAGSTGLLAGSLAGWAAAVGVVLWGGMRHSSRGLWQGLKSLNLRQRARQYVNFPRYSVPYTFIGTLRLEAVKLLLGSSTGSVLVGDFSFAQRLTNFPVTLFCGGIRPVLYQKAARSDDPGSLELFIRRSIMVLVLIAVPLGVLFEIKAREILFFLVGPQWSGAIPFARVLVIPAMGMMFLGWLDRMFDVKGRQDQALFLQLLFTLLGLVCFGLGLWLWRKPLLAVSLQGLVTFLHMSFAALFVYRIFGFPLNKLNRVLLFPIGLALVVAVCWWFLGEIVGDWLALGLGSVLAWSGGALYLRRTVFKTATRGRGQP
jgi:O-antigen/teichoic acid export membrane protein